MNIDRLRTFQAVAELRHFAKAAALRNLSQPAVSHQIALLEEAVGARLFNRSGRVVSLTVVGEVLLEEARRVLSALDRAEERVREAVRGATGRIRLGASPTAGLYLLSELLVRYRAAHPSYELRLDLGREADLLDRVALNELDMAILAGPVPTADLRVRPLASDALVAVGVPGVVRGGAPRDRLRQHVWILREPGCDTRRMTEAWFAKQGGPPQQTLSVHGPDAVKRAALAGLGIGVISSRCVKTELDDGRLALAAPRLALPGRRFGIVDHRHKHHGAACRAMLEALESLREAKPGTEPARPARGSMPRKP